MATGNGYTPTRYVAPFGEIGGATSDLQDQGATAYTNASSSLTPCTFGTALARAGGGQIVQLGPGRYVGPRTAEGDLPIFVGLGGSVGNPVIYTAQWPVVYNETEPALYTQFARSNDIAPPEQAFPNNSCPIFGETNYYRLDGIYFSYADGAMPCTRGIIYAGFGRSGNEVSRCLFDRTDLNGDDDNDNYNCIQTNEADALVVENNWFRNGFSTVSNHNSACVTLYSASSFTIEHNLFDNVTCGLYIKGTTTAVANSGLVRYNHFDECRIGMECAITDDSGTNAVEITQNLFVEPTGAEHSLAFDAEAGGTAMRYFNVHHNTFISAGDEDDGPIVIDASVDGTGCQFVNNIVAAFVSSTQVTVNGQGSLTNFTAWDYNRYYENGNTPQYFYSGSNRNGLAAWQSATSRDANATVGDPQFVSQGTGNYRLAGGSPCLTLSSTGGPIGCYLTGSETIGIEDFTPPPVITASGCMPAVLVVC